MKTLKLAAVSALFASSLAFAQDAGTTAPPPPTPSAQEIKKVVEYYMNGAAGGPVLVEFKPCTKVDSDKASATWNECIEPVSGDVTKGKTVSAWMMWFVPKGSKFDDVTVQLLLDGNVRETKDVPLSDSMRSRTWKSFNLSKPGKWTFKIVRGGNELAKADVNVK